MASIITNLLSRRGRRNTYESQFDSTWGDMHITSPTDKAQVWHHQKLKVAMPLSKQFAPDRTPDLCDGATPTEFLEPSPTDAGLPQRYSKFDFNFHQATSDSASTFSFLPTPNFTPLHSPSQISSQAHKGLAIFDVNAKTGPGMPMVPNLGLMSRRGNNDALIIYGLNSPDVGTASPLYTQHKASGHSQIGSPTSPAQLGDHVVCVPSRIRLSPTAIAALAHQPSTISLTNSQQIQSPTSEYYSSLDDAAESLKSPFVALLSPVSETFSFNGELRSEDGIISLDVTADDHNSPQSPCGRVGSGSGVDRRKDSNATSVNSVSLLRFLQEPSDYQSEDQGTLTELSSQLLLRAPSRTESIILDDDVDYTYREPSVESKSSTPTFGRMNDTGTDLHPTNLRSPKVPSTSPSHAQISETSLTESESVERRPMESASMMKFMSPPLSTTARMRKQTLPTSPNTQGSPSNESDTFRWNKIGQAPGTANTVSHIQRQRRNSFEPPPSPALFDRNILFAHQAANADQLYHRRQQSDYSSRHAYIPIREHGDYVQRPPHHYRQQSSSSYASPTVYSDSNSPTSGELNVYDSIREDCRLISRESRATKNGALVAQFKATAEPARSSPQKVRARARSTSRMRDRFIRQQPRVEDKPPRPQIQLVPSGKEMWE